LQSFEDDRFNRNLASVSPATILSSPFLAQLRRTSFAITDDEAKAVVRGERVQRRNSSPRAGEMAQAKAAVARYSETIYAETMI
jgi:hypothetical protein